MKAYERKSLNIKRLLALGILDIRGIAAGDEALCANEYFSKVERFIENAPYLIGDLSRAAETPESLESIKSALEEIGCYKLNPDLDAIRLAIQGPDRSLAGELSAGAALKLGELYDALKGTHLIKRFAASRSGGEAGDGVLLKEALEFFDHEEANRKLRVLAVDDVSIVLNKLTSVLSPYYEVFALKNSSQVEGFLRHTTPELFLLDIEMGEINGFDLVPVIRQFEEHRDTPIIFLTGNASYDNLREAVELGSCDFITKPIDKDILLEKIAKNIVYKRSY